MDPWSTHHTSNDLIGIERMNVGPRAYVIYFAVFHVRIFDIVDETYICIVGELGTLKKIVESFLVGCAAQFDGLAVDLESTYFLIEQFGSWGFDV
jgi:hypothetical protein